jgi:lipopolysaccharide export LptBFGC system permease protein LptF
MRSAGLSLGRIFLPVICFAVFCAGAGLLLSEKVVPWAFREQTDWQQYLYNLPADPVKTGIAMDTDEFTVIPGTLQRLPGGQLHIELRDTILLDKFPKPGEFPKVQRIKRMEYQDGAWKLEGMDMYQWEKTGELNIYSNAPIGRLQERLALGQGFLSNIPENVRLGQMSFQELTKEREMSLRFRGKDRARLLDVSRWFKLTLPLMALPFGLCGVALALRFSRTGAFTGVLLSMGIVVAGVAVLFGMQALALTGKIPALPAAFVAPVFFTLLGAILLRKQE